MQENGHIFFLKNRLSLVLGGRAQWSEVNFRFSVSLCCHCYSFTVSAASPLIPLELASLVLGHWRDDQFYPVQQLSDFHCPWWDFKATILLHCSVTAPRSVTATIAKEISPKRGFPLQTVMEHFLYIQSSRRPQSCKALCPTGVVAVHNSMQTGITIQLMGLPVTVVSQTNHSAQSEETQVLVSPSKLN